MITNIKLEGKYIVINCTRGTQKKETVGAKVLGNNVAVGGTLKIEKNNNIKNIIVEHITQVRTNRYRIKNSNFCVIIKKI